MATKRNPPTTRTEHQVNHLKKQVAGHVTLIADLQRALKTAQERMLSAERKESIAWSACALLEQTAREVAAELPEERRNHWLAQFPCLGTKDETKEETKEETRC